METLAGLTLNSDIYGVHELVQAYIKVHLQHFETDDIALCLCLTDSTNMLSFTVSVWCSWNFKEVIITMIACAS